jgi:hypothetical protein
MQRPNGGRADCPRCIGLLKFRFGFLRQVTIVQHRFIAAVGGVFGVYMKYAARWHHQTALNQNCGPPEAAV